MQTCILNLMIKSNKKCGYEQKTTEHFIRAYGGKKEKETQYKKLNWK